jgi:hypothetical protein
LRVAVAELINPPAPLSAELIVKIPLFVYVPVNAADGIVRVPLIVFEAPLKVYTPVPAVNVPFTEKLPLIANVKVVLVKVPVALTVRSAQAALAVIVTALLPSITTISPATGKLAPAAPPDVADQVELAFQFPVATEYRFAPITLSVPSNISIASKYVFEV